MTGPKLRIDTASAPEVLAHLERCSAGFSPPLAERVGLVDYAARLTASATRFEAWDGAALIGLVAVYCNAPDLKRAFVSNVSVDPPHQRKGISRLLMQTAAGHARELGFAEMSLEVDAGATSALALYRTLGFTKVGEVGRTLTMHLDLGRETA